MLRFLGNELRSDCRAGTKDAYLAIRTDPQLENRFHPIILPVWEEGDELNRLIQSFVATFPLRKPSFLSSAELQRWILARSGGTIGEIAALLRSTAVAAVESGEEAINQRSLCLMKYQGPAERRRFTEKLLVYYGQKSADSSPAAAARSFVFMAMAARRCIRHGRRRIR